MKLKNNSKGFTLIELLVTVAIMLSILIISIVSITGVSDRKKKEAKKTVEEEIKSAAEQYLDANEYLFTNQELNNGYIYLKELIEKGYLNKVTNPLTGKPYNGCSEIEIKNNGRSVKVVKFEESNDWSCPYTTFCSSGLKVETEYLNNNREVIDVSKLHNGWFNHSLLGDEGLAVKLTVKKGKENVKFKVAINGGNETTMNEVSYIDEDSFKEDTNDKRVDYKIMVGNEICHTYVSAKIDTVPPTTPNVKLYKLKNNGEKPKSSEGLDEYEENSWSNKEIFTEAEGSTDTGSGFDHYEYKIKVPKTEEKNARYRYKIIDYEGTSDISYKACDKAGNCSENKATVKLDKTPPTITLNREQNEKDFTYKIEDTGGSGVEKYFVADKNVSDSVLKTSSWKRYINSETSLTGTINYGDNETKIYLYAKDHAGNISFQEKTQYKTCDVVKETDTPRAYFWALKRHDCDNKNGPQNVYSFNEWKCPCEIDTLSKDFCKLNPTERLDELHSTKDKDNGSLRLITVKYRNNANGKTACKSDNRQNEYVLQVCYETKLSKTKSSAGVHGYQWFYEKAEVFTSFTSPGWYHSGGWYNGDVIKEAWKTKVADNNTNRDNACKAACKAAAGYYRRVKNN